MASRALLKKEATTWLAVSAVTSLLCAGGFLSIGGALFCYLAREAAEDGGLADAEAKLQWGKILTVVGGVVGLFVAGLAATLHFLRS